MKLSNSELMNLYEQLTVDTMGISEDGQEMIYNLMMDKLNHQKWFRLYEANFEEN